MVNDQLRSEETKKQIKIIQEFKIYLKKNHIFMVQKKSSDNVTNF